MPEIAFEDIDYNKLQYLEPSVLRNFQLKKLKEELTYLGLKSKFYKSMFEQHGINISGIESLEKFRNIPFTSKDNLQLSTDDFVCIEAEDIADYCSTSGTLGNPVIVKLSQKDLDRLALNESLGLEIAGIKASDLVLLTTTIDKQFMAGLAYFSGIRKLGAGVIRNGAASPASQWDLIAKLSPSVIIAVPSFLLKMIDFAKESGIDWKGSSIKKAICIGETIRNPDLTLNTLGRRISEEWPLALHSTYASTEMQTAFTECEEGKGGHLLPGLVYPEIINENGEVVEDGSAGELVITTFDVEGMPLLRYKTGDICSIDYAPCRCGRLTPRLRPLSGRKNQMLKVKGTTLYPAMIFNVLDGFSDVKAYVLEAFTNIDGNDEVKIAIGTNKFTNIEYIKEIEDQLQSVIRVKLPLELKSPDEIVKMQSLRESRKAVKFVDHRKPQ